MGALVRQFVVPLLSEAADEGFAEILVEGHAAFLAFADGASAHVPAVVVDGLKLAIFVDAQGVEVAADGFGPVGFAVAVGLLDGAKGGAVVAPGHVGTLAVVDQGGARLGGIVEGGDPVAMNHFDAGLCHVRLYGGEYALEDGDFCFKERCPAVALHAALALALGEVAAETLVGDVFGDDAVLYD